MAYPDVPSAIKPLPHGPGIPIPSPPEHIEVHEEINMEVDQDYDTSESYQVSTHDMVARPFTQVQLNDLTRDLGVSKANTQLLGSRLRESNLLA